MNTVYKVLRSLPTGEGILPLLLVAMGSYWIAEALRLGIWAGSRPGSGLMPLAYGALLVAFSLAVLAFVAVEGPAPAEESTGKPLLLIGLLILTVLGFPVIGGVASLFLMTLVMYVVVERLPWPRSLGIAAAATASYYLVFDRWLSVTLPAGPWGF